jgi:hypothetical protein
MAEERMEDTRSPASCTASKVVYTIQKKPGI